MDSTVNQGIVETSSVLLPFIYGSLVPMMVALYSQLVKETDLRLTNMNINTGRDSGASEVYDFIIVGAGSAGSVLANRISEHFNVLLLERGGEPVPLQAIPANAITFFNDPYVDYRFRTVPQNSSCLALNNRQSSWSRGMGLGGSSNLNFMVYLRSHPQDYDNWANVTGDDRWSYRNILPFFEKSEDYCLECETKQFDPTFNPYFHYKGGYLTVGKPSSQPLVEEFLEASEWSGIQRTDLNAYYKTGCAPVVLSQRNGRRCSAKIAFLDPIRNRKTLTIRKYARVYKVLIRGKNNEAYGVEYEHHDRKRSAFASKEVILSVGTIETPKLLMLSGIGPKKHLESLGIKVLVNLQGVGKNLQDHIGTFLGPFLINKPMSILADRDVTIEAVNEFVQHGKGPLTSTGLHATSFHASTLAHLAGEGDWPDIQTYLASTAAYSFVEDTYAKAFNLNRDIMKEYIDPVKNVDAFMIPVFLGRPKVRGEILLASANFKDDPILDPKYFEDEENVDLKVLLEGVLRAVNISENAPSFVKLGSRMSPVPFPPCKSLVFRSEEYWECFLRQYSISLFHYSGTAAMGKKRTSKAVVDSELRVIGTKKLRVIDASVMPYITTANTNGPTIMIGERGAQFVLETWNIGT